jgi:hypothetical protein
VIRGVAYSRRPAATLVAGLAAVVLAGLLGARERSVFRHEHAAAAELEARLAGQAVAGTPYTADKLETLKSHIRELRGRLGDAEAWTQVRETLRHQWRPEGDTAAERGGYSVRTGAFRMASASTSDWPKIVATVAALERIPGVGVGLLELAAGGSPGPRPMDLVRVTVVVHSRNGPSNPSHENP